MEGPYLSDADSNLYPSFEFTRRSRSCRLGPADCSAANQKIIWKSRMLDSRALTGALALRNANGRM